MKHTVVLIPLDNYEQQNVDAAVAQGLSLLGGVESIIGKEEKVLLKPNLLARALPRRPSPPIRRCFPLCAKC